METKKPKKNTRYIIIVFIVITALLAFAAGYFYMQYQILKKDPDKISKTENKVLIAEVAKIYSLPQDEDPTIATINDKDKLKDQAFFASAENGDKILIYTKAKKAVIYRPKQKVVVNSGPIVLEQNK